MKIFISADIEGICGVSAWEEITAASPEYAACRRQMTAEVRAACEGAIAAGAAEILVRDAHGSARNIIHSELPREARLVRGWSGGPMMMMDGLEPGFSAAVYIGYHARAGSAASPMSHTMSTSLAEFIINGKPVSEFEINAWAAAGLKVPSVFISGDKSACAQARRLLPNIGFTATKENIGEATVHMHPLAALDRISAGVQAALMSKAAKKLPGLPKNPVMELRFKEIKKARRFSCYPGAERTGDATVRLKCADWREIMRAIQFIY
ncbi:MAG: M55 family metallopeptidase [Elusimicrobia bacterium]|nr:M55 family metallopeptidase [Elusimicrobiota bacterium]